MDKNDWLRSALIQRGASVSLATRICSQVIGDKAGWTVGCLFDVLREDKDIIQFGIHKGLKYKRNIGNKSIPIILKVLEDYGFDYNDLTIPKQDFTLGSKIDELIELLKEYKSHQSDVPRG